MLIAIAAVLLAFAVSTAHAKRSYTEQVICLVFGSYCSQALQVAWCESRYQTWARNGQYLGLFQMGSTARAMFGHGPDVWSQARAAYRYFVYAGHSWSPWACRPW